MGRGQKRCVWVLLLRLHCAALVARGMEAGHLHRPRWTGRMKLRVIGGCDVRRECSARCAATVEARTGTR